MIRKGDRLENPVTGEILIFRRTSRETDGESVLVETIVLYSAIKFRMRPGEELQDGPPIHGNTKLELGWTILPADAKLAIMEECGFTVTKNPSEMGRLLKGLI